MGLIPFTSPDPSALTQLSTWLVFLCLFVISWNVASMAAMRRFDNDTSDNETGGNFRRPYVLVLGMYGYAIAVLNIGICALFLYCVCTTLCLASPYVPEWLEKPLLLFMPSLVFNCISMDHLKFHGAVSACVLVAMSVMTWTYVSDDDLRDIPSLRRKVLRMISVFPSSVLFNAYLLYAVYSIVSAHQMASASNGGGGGG